MRLSILFIPFDAAIQHYGRNAKLGVTGYTMQKDVVGKKRRRNEDEEEEVESPGNAYEFRPQKKLRLNPSAARRILSSELELIIQHTCKQILDETSMTYSHPHEGLSLDLQATQQKFEETLARRQAAGYPDVLFLSEQPGELEFPQTITLTTDQGVPVIYRLLGTTGKRAVQRIYGYVRQTLSGIWSARSLVKKTAPFNVEENVLLIHCDIYGARCSIAGVHLSSKNVGASESVSKKIMSSLVSFCEAQKPPIQFVIGDFNIDARVSTYEGNVGSLPNSTVYMAQYRKSTMGVQYQEQYSNSTNTKHFMAHLVVDPKVSLRGQVGLSLQRSLNGDYFSDHPPLYVELEVA